MQKQGTSKQNKAKRCTIKATQYQSISKRNKATPCKIKATQNQSNAKQNKAKQRSIKGKQNRSNATQNNAKQSKPMHVNLAFVALDCLESAPEGQRDKKGGRINFKMRPKKAFEVFGGQRGAKKTPKWGPGGAKDALGSSSPPQAVF